MPVRNRRPATTTTGRATAASRHFGRSARLVDEDQFFRLEHNAVRLQLHALAYNLGNFMCTLALPNAVEQWSLTTLREKMVKIGAKIVRHGRFIVFQMAEVAIPRELFADILRRIDRLRPTPAPT